MRATKKSLATTTWITRPDSAGDRSWPTSVLPTLFEFSRSRLPGQRAIARHSTRQLWASSTFWTKSSVFAVPCRRPRRFQRREHREFPSVRTHPYLGIDSGATTATLIRSHSIGDDL